MTGNNAPNPVDELIRTEFEAAYAHVHPSFFIRRRRDDTYPPPMQDRWEGWQAAAKAYRK
jgi:hypothetical protein